MPLGDKLIFAFGAARIYICIYVSLQFNDLSISATARGQSDKNEKFIAALRRGHFLSGGDRRDSFRPVQRYIYSWVCAHRADEIFPTAKFIARVMERVRRFFVVSLLLGFSAGW